jgi:hypothetical protein
LVDEKSTTTPFKFLNVVPPINRRYSGSFLHWQAPVSFTAVAHANQLFVPAAGLLVLAKVSQVLGQQGFVDDMENVLVWKGCL